MTTAQPPTLNTDQAYANPTMLLDVLMALRVEVVDERTRTLDRWMPHVTRESFHASAENLAAYLSLRRRDLRDIQEALVPYGLSSLGRMESRVMPNLDAVINSLAAIGQIDRDDLPPRPTIEDFWRGRDRIESQSSRLFGDPQGERRVRIMVTMPGDAITDGAFVQELVERGMDCARINCAHDTPEDWSQMIAHIRQASEVTGRSVKVAMDLAGPKCRTANVRKPKGKDRLVQLDDHIRLTPDKPPKSSDFLFQARCTLPSALEQVGIGAAVWFDDGKIGTVVERRDDVGVILRVTQASPDGEKLRTDKGINFPDTALDLTPLTEKDLTDLDFVVAHADVVNYSFVQTADDMRLLQDEIAKRRHLRDDGLADLAIVAKIETTKAVRNLPEIIVQAAGKQLFGVMIARGDLAVEIGYQRLAEIQEEILWICEAAHVPVIWATQVLEGLAKDGRPSRAEITDAAMAERAECVMLNKGPFIRQAIIILDEVLTKMNAHQIKKTPRLRALRSW